MPPLDGTQLLNDSWCVECYCIENILLTLISATSVDIEHAFSQGRLLLSHVHSHLSVKSTCASMCLGAWSLHGLVKNSDIKAVTVLPELAPNASEDKLSFDWDAIVI